MDGPKRFEKFTHTDGRVYKIDVVHYQIGADTFRVTARKPDGTVLGAKIKGEHGQWRTDVSKPRSSAFQPFASDSTGAKADDTSATDASPTGS